MDYYSLKNSVWPNGLKKDEDGYMTFYPLGTNKVNITTITWPKGDKLITPFVYKNDKLVGFVDGKSLTTDSQTTIYLPYEHIEAEFSAIDKGQLQIHAPNATTKKVSWKDSGKEDIAEAQFKYKGCKTRDNVKTVDANYKTTDVINGVWSEPLWDLTDGGAMFYNCSNLTSFSSDLSNLTFGSEMFRNCSNLILFNSDLPSLTNGSYMFFKCSKLITFNIDLPKMTNGTHMFTGSQLTSFSSDLSNLMDGDYMFYNCSQLTSFSSDLPIMTEGNCMFSGCKLDAPSVKNIIDTINSYSGILDIGMGCNDTTEDKNLFAQEIGYANMTALLAALEHKRWRVTTQYNGRPTATYGLRRPSEDTLPVFAKLEETEEYANYTSIDESKKYRLNWFHETTGSTEGYTQFNSLEEAIEHFNIKPIERNS